MLCTKRKILNKTYGERPRVIEHMSRHCSGATVYRDLPRCFCKDRRIVEVYNCVIIDYVCDQYEMKTVEYPTEHLWTSKSEPHWSILTTRRRPTTYIQEDTDSPISWMLWGRLCCACNRYWFEQSWVRRSYISQIGQALCQLDSIIHSHSSDDIRCCPRHQVEQEETSWEDMLTYKRNTKLTIKVHGWRWGWIGHTLEKWSSNLGDCGILKSDLYVSWYIHEAFYWRRHQAHGLVWRSTGRVHLSWSRTLIRWGVNADDSGALMLYCRRIGLEGYLRAHASGRTLWLHIFSYRRACNNLWLGDV